MGRGCVLLLCHGGVKNRRGCGAPAVAVYILLHNPILTLYLQISRTGSKI
jgi:hypothetical protein